MTNQWLKTSLLLLFLGSASFTSAQEGIQFVHDSWENVLKMAKEQKKYIFMDAYASWCGPCKMMSRDVFTQKEVGDFYNENFINVKIDMEKGEGKELAKRYKVQAYPTLLFINSDGEMVHRSLGFQPGEEFLELGAAAIDETQQYGMMAKRYEDGEKGADFLYNFTKACYLASDDRIDDVAAAYLATQDDWLTEKNMDFIATYSSDMDSKGFQFILDNRAKFDETFGAGLMEDMLSGAIYNKVRSMGMQLDPAVIEADMKRIFPGNSEKHVAEFHYMLYADTDLEKFTTAAETYIMWLEKENTAPDQMWSAYNSLAWSYYERVDNKKDLKKAMKWAKKSVKINSNYYNTDTLASLYYKLGKKKAAIKMAKTAIKEAEAAEMDPAGTKELLKKIENM